MDELTSSQEAFPASPSLVQGKEKAHKMTVTSGLRCLESYERFPQHSSWVRMFVASLIGLDQMENPIWYSTRCALTWRLRGTKSHRLYFQLVAKTLPTDEIEFSLLPDPQTVNREKTEEQARERHEKYGGTTRGLYLTDQAAMGMLPTPTAFDYNTPRSQEAWDKAKEKHGDALQNPLKQMAAFGLLPTPTTKNVTGGAVQVNKNGKRQNKGGTEFSAQLHDLAKSQMLPTPMAQEHDKITGKENQDSLTKRVREETGQTSQLSPLFVEEMMGFPKNWTALPFQNGEKKASKPTATP